MTRSVFIIIVACCTLVGCSSEHTHKPPVVETTINYDGLQIPVYNYENLRILLNRNGHTFYVYNFWATWCGPCVAELPEIEKFNANHQNDNVAVVLISLDMASAWAKTLPEFVYQKGFKSEVIVLHEPDANSWISDIYGGWDGAIPATLISYNGRTKFHRGTITLSELEETYQAMLNP